MNKEGSCFNHHVGIVMERSLVLFCVFVTAFAAPALGPRRPMLGHLEGAAAGIELGKSVTHLATGIASQSLGLAGHALGGIPLFGPLAQFGTSMGQAGVQTGNNVAQMALGIGQAAVKHHTVGRVQGSATQNFIQGLLESTKASETRQNENNNPTPINRPTPVSQPNVVTQTASEVPRSDDVSEDDSEYYDAYDSQENWNDQNEMNVEQETTTRPPPPQPTYVGDE